MHFLYIDSGAVNVINSTLSDNTARLGGIWLNKGTLNVNNATFENNVVTVGNGGAIHIESDSSTATIKDSKFIGNKANKDGGAIYNKGALNIETSILMLMQLPMEILVIMVMIFTIQVS